MPATKSGNYWRASVVDDRGFRVSGEIFNAVSVETDARSVYLHIGGLPTKQSTPFRMPADPAMLRDLADALCKTAEDIESNWKSGAGAVRLLHHPR